MHPEDLIIPHWNYILKCHISPYTHYIYYVYFILSFLIDGKSSSNADLFRFFVLRVRDNCPWIRSKKHDDGCCGVRACACVVGGG